MPQQWIVKDKSELDFFLLVTSLKNLFLFNPWHYPIFDTYTLNPIYITKSPENFTTITPPIKENLNSKFTVSNTVGHPVVYSNVTDKLVEANLRPHNPNPMVNFSNEPSAKVDIKFDSKIKSVKHNDNKIVKETNSNYPWN